MKKFYIVLTTILYLTINANAQGHPNDWFNTNSIIETFPSFEFEGVKYTMIYTTHKSNMKEITSVYFIPDGYDKYANDNIEPPRFEKLILHNLGDDNKNFAGVWVSEFKVIERLPVIIFKEIRLPDDIANKLIDMLYGDYKLPPNKYLKEDCVKNVFDSNLLPTEYSEYY